MGMWLASFYLPCTCQKTFTKLWSPFLFQITFYRFMDSIRLQVRGVGVGGGGLSYHECDASQCTPPRDSNGEQCLFFIVLRFVKAYKEVSYSLFSPIIQYQHSMIRVIKCVQFLLMLVHQYCPLFTSWMQCISSDLIFSFRLHFNELSLAIIYKLHLYCYDI